jgi:hypothetical protein
LVIISQTGWTLDYLEDLKGRLDMERFAKIKQFYVMKEQIQLRNQGE